MSTFCGPPVPAQSSLELLAPRNLFSDAGCPLEWDLAARCISSPLRVGTRWNARRDKSVVRVDRYVLWAHTMLKQNPKGIVDGLCYLYESEARSAQRFRYALLAFDIATVLFIVATSFVPNNLVLERLDIASAWSPRRLPGAIGDQPQPRARAPASCIACGHSCDRFFPRAHSRRGGGLPPHPAHRSAVAHLPASRPAPAGQPGSAATRKSFSPR